MTIGAGADYFRQSGLYAGPDAEEVTTMLNLVGAKLYTLGSRASGCAIHIPGKKIEILDEVPTSYVAWRDLIQGIMK